MNIRNVAAQLFTIRDFIKTPEDIAKSLRRVREIGYEAVQISAMGPIPEEDLVKILRDEGLVCCATHEPSQVVLDNPEALVDRLQKLDCQYTAYPYPGGVDLSDPAQVNALAGRLEHAGEVLAKAGLTLTYHNHATEWIRHDGRLVMEMILDATRPEHLKMEIDTYWVQVGGGDPVDWCRRLGNRLPLLHMKDYGMTKEKGPVMAEIGRGNLNFPAIVAAAEESGCRWFIVEQDVCPGDPFESLKLSFDYIRENLVS